MNAFSLNSYRGNFALVSSHILIVAAFLLSAVLLLVVDLPRGSLFWTAVQNSGHTLLFALLTLFCLVLLRSRVQALTKAKALLAVTCIAVFSFGIELVQSLIGRDASVADMLLNAVGILVGSILYVVYSVGVLNYKTQIGLLVIALGILGFNFKQPAKYALANILQPSLPDLASFEYLGAKSKVASSYGAIVDIVSDPVDWHENSSKVLRIQLQPRIWSGFTLLELHVDWTDYAYFTFEAFNPSNISTEVTLRIHDVFHNNEENDRFSQRLSLTPGTNSITIPVDRIRLDSAEINHGREIDLANIQEVKIYTTKVQSSEILFFDNFRLN